MLDNMNDYLQTVYASNKYLYAVLVLLICTALAFTSETVASIPAAWNKLAPANRRKGSPRW
jgi:hypothetical protein